jgi:signal transduction histidine kinase
MVGLNLREFLTAAGRAGFTDYLQTLQRDGEASGVMGVRTARGEPRFWRFRNVLREGPDGRYVIGFAQDVTEERLVEQLRDDLTNTLVHDLKSPLTSIMGCLEVLGMSAARDFTAQEKKTLDIAVSNSRRLLALVNTILDVSRLESGVMPMEPEPVGLSAVVSEVVDLQRPVADAKRVTLKFDVPAQLPSALADRSLVSRVLQNLVGNAVKFTPSDGDVRIAAEMYAKQGGFLAVRVSDSGTGIPEEMRGRLFQKFAFGRQAGRGSGLGLLFCRLAVEAHGGRIWVEPSAQGASFGFTLPVFDETSPMDRTGSRRVVRSS